MKKMTKQLLGIFVTALMIGGGAVYSAAGGGYPQGSMVIDGKNPAQFTHQTHIDVGLDCAACHHDASHAPLSAEAIGVMADTAALQCVNCHNESFANKDLQARKDVFHARCRECHKEGYNGKNGPTKCNDCHVKKEKKKLEGC